MTKKVKYIIIACSLVLVVAVVAGSLVLSTSKKRSQAAISKSIDDYYASTPVKSNKEDVEKSNNTSTAVSKPSIDSPCAGKTAYEVRTSSAVSCIHGGD